MVLCYDYALTFSEEVNCVWKRNLSGVTVTYILLRYSAILYSFAVLAQHAIFGPQNRLAYVPLEECKPQLTHSRSCEFLGHLAAVIESFAFLGLSSESRVCLSTPLIDQVTVFCTLRVYAILGMNIKVAVLVCALITAPICVNLVRMSLAVCKFLFVMILDQHGLVQ